MSRDGTRLFLIFTITACHQGGFTSDVLVLPALDCMAQQAVNDASQYLEYIRFSFRVPSSPAFKQFLDCLLRNILGLVPTRHPSAKYALPVPITRLPQPVSNQPRNDFSPRLIATG